VVFASNRAGWLLKLAGQVSVERREELVRGKQFGSLFDDDGPEHLPFSVDGHAAWLNGSFHALASAPLDWPDDGGGQWRVVRLQDRSAWLPLWRDLAAAAGALLAVWLLALVVTGRQRQQEATRRLRFENEKRMREITNNLPVAVYQFRVGADGRPVFNFMSPAITAITGLQPNDVLGDGSVLFALLDPDGRDGPGGLLAQVAEAPAAWTCAGSSCTAPARTSRAARTCGTATWPTSPPNTMPRRRWARPSRRRKTPHAASPCSWRI
jgi:two-component system sensor histidine kinase/response regulator